MSEAIRIPVDVTNPGQFFACCGLLELAARLWPGTAGQFTDRCFVIEARSSVDANLPTVFQAFSACPLVGDESTDSDSEREKDEDNARPMLLAKPFDMTLDWWSDKALKPWAGSMNASLIFQAMRVAINPNTADPFQDLRVVNDPQDPGQAKKKLKKREPFYFDARRGGNAKSLDIGFAPDAFSMTSDACPAVESLCMVGLQRFRPMPTDRPRVFDYCTWGISLPPTVAAAAACGMLPGIGGRRFRFENAFRTDQRKHKGFLPAREIAETDGGYQ